jgi:hypothetical protein
VILSPDTLYTFKKAVSSIGEKGQMVMKVRTILNSTLEYLTLGLRLNGRDGRDSVSIFTDRYTAVV